MKKNGMDPVALDEMFIDTHSIRQWYFEFTDIFKSTENAILGSSWVTCDFYTA